MNEKQIQEVMALVKELAQYAPYTTGVRYCAAIERALREQVREVPEGWRLVPVEPTNEMVQAGKVCASAQMVWREMLSAAPTQPAQAEQPPTGFAWVTVGDRRMLARMDATVNLTVAQVSQPKAAQQEPIGYLYSWVHSSATGRPDETFTAFAETLDAATRHKSHFNIRPVYTAAAPQREPMTREQRRRIIDEALFNTEGLTQDDFAQEIVSGVERFHNITRAAMSLTDEQINDAYGAALVQHGHIPHDDVVRIARAIESATAAPLLERIRQLEQAVKWEADLCQQALESRAELEQQLEAARKDAERYRWLRSEKTGHCKAISILEAVGDGGQVSVKCCEDLDAAIDAAISKEQA